MLTNSVTKCPKGYPRLAAFLDSDENFMLYRRFGFLQARLLLYKQDELREMEKELDRLDRIDEKKNATILKCREEDDVLFGKRKELFKKIEIKLKKYCEFTVIRNLAFFSDF
jgi:hypothetical protein